MDFLYSHKFTRSVSPWLYSTQQTQDVVDRIFEFFNKSAVAARLPTEVCDSSGKKHPVSPMNLAFFLSMSVVNQDDQPENPDLQVNDLDPIDILIRLVNGPDQRAINHFCSGRMTFDAHSRSLILGVGHPVNPDGDAEEFSALVSEFLSRIQNGCEYMVTYFRVKYTVLSNGKVVHTAHANILFTWKKSATEIVAALYEPHGNKLTSSEMRQKQTTRFFDSFCEETARQGVKMTYMSPLQVNCYMGAQSYDVHRNGLCYMFSLFWVFCALMVVRNIEPRQDLFRVISGLEASILRYEHNVYEILPNFMFLLTGGYFKYAVDVNRWKSAVADRIMTSVTRNLERLSLEESPEGPSPCVDWDKLQRVGDYMVYSFAEHLLVPLSRASEQTIPLEVRESVETYGGWKKVFSNPVSYRNVETGAVSLKMPQNYYMAKYNAKPKQVGDWVRFFTLRNLTDGTTSSEEVTVAPEYKNIVTGEITQKTPTGFNGYNSWPRAEVRGNFGREWTDDGSVYIDLLTGKQCSKVPNEFRKKK